MSIHAIRFVSIATALAALGALGSGCSAADADAGELVGDAEQAIEFTEPSPNPQDGTAGDVSSIFKCASDRIMFEGSCRKAKYFERFTTEGSTLVAVEGSQSKLDAGPAIAVLEMPNAHTYRVRIISTASTSGYLLGAKYSDGHEVISETTTTFLTTDGAFKEVITTVAARQGASFETVWYERVAKGGIGDRNYTWSSDLCHDVYGNPLFEEGEMCGPLTAIPTSGDGAVSDECKSWGKVAGGIGQAGCMIGIAYLGFQAAAGTTAIVLASAGTAAPTAVGLLGALTTAAIGSGICAGVKDLAQGLGELACDAMTDTPASTPPAIGIELDTGTSITGDDGCAEMGGTMYYGAVNITTSGSCDDAENESSNGFLELFSATDDVSEEVVVYGDPACEPTTSTMAPAGGLCIIVSG